MGVLPNVLAAILAQSGASWSPQALFGAGDVGSVLDFATAANLATDTAGTTAVTATGQRIAYAKDLSGKTKHATQTTSANRPKWGGHPTTLGAELLTDGRLNSGGGAWTAGAGWSVSGVKATKTAGTASAFSQAITVAADDAVMVFWAMERTAGTLTMQMTGGTTVSAPARSLSGSYHAILFAEAGNNTIEFLADAAFAGTVYTMSAKVVSAWADRGAVFDGTNDKVQTASIDFTGSDKATLMISSTYMRPTGESCTAAELVNYYAGTAGSAAIIYGSYPGGYIRGASAQGNITAPAAEGRGGFQIRHVNTMRIDLSGSATSDKVKLRARGMLPTQTTGLAPAGAGNMGNGALAVGGAVNNFIYHNGLIHRVIAIGRYLTDAEVTQAEQWLKAGGAFIAVIGDSTSATNSAATALPVAMNTSAFVGGAVDGAAMIAASGDRLSNQTTAWNALSGKSTLQAVIIQIGLNDIKARVGENLATAATVISELQTLVSLVKSTVGASCKVMVSQLTPCKQWLQAATNGAAAYAGWQAVNTAIAGGGATPITGADGSITAHVALVSDGSDNLAPDYDQNGDHVHLSTEARFIVAQQWRAALIAVGVLS